jgi:CheY-like chemotaxis protein
MPTLASESPLSHLLSTARAKVATDMASIAKPTPDVALQVAADLRAIAGEAATLGRPDLSKSAGEGEAAARLLAGGNAGALVPCMRSLRQLGYLLQEAWEGQEKNLGRATSRAVPVATLRLLVVDDSPIAAAALADVFEMHDFSVRVASTLDEASNLFASFAPSVLVSDVHMPNVDVADLCRCFRAAVRDRRSAIVLVSGRSEAELSGRMAEIKPDAFVSKLAGAVAVVARVTSLCREIFA